MVKINSDTILKTEKINFAYEKKQVVNNINLTVNKGEFIGIIGPNGSGKTTLLKILSGVLIPSTGKVLLEDKNISDYSRKEIARKIAVVPQMTGFVFPFTVCEVVLMGRAPYLKRLGFETDEDYEIAKDAMKMTDTSEFEERMISDLSGGERQRVIIARALAQSPDILILDEPTSSLDIKYQIEIYKLIAKLNREKKITVIVVSHDLNLISHYCDQIMLLHKGNIKALGSPDEVINQENIKEIYHIDVDIKKIDTDGTRWIFPKMN